jgi:hypothetical protein
MGKNEKKITVKHYLNYRAKPKNYKGTDFFPLYIQIIVAGKKAQIKSKINEHLKIYRSDIARLTNHDHDLSNLILNGSFSEGLLSHIRKENHFPLCYLLDDEINVITKIIRLKKPFNNSDFSLRNFTTDYAVYTREVTDFLDAHIKKCFSEELQSIFLSSIDKPEQKMLFKLSNFFLHFINWNHRFSSLYAEISSVLSEQYHAVQEHFSFDLSLTIDAYIAYHQQVKVLKRFFEKRELGKITVLSLLDWKTEVKEMLQSEFARVYGEPTASEYINKLDHILDDGIPSYD